VTEPVSSSFHAVNADQGLGPVDRVKWVAFNALNNAVGGGPRDPQLALKRFPLSAADARWPEIPAASSPARRLCDLFWLELPWERIAMALGGQINAVEIGCGTGRYGELLRRCAGVSLRRYLGVDLTPHPEWASLKVRGSFDFAVADAARVAEHLAGANFIITQSALEHFEEDLTFFRHVAAYVNAQPGPVLQAHLVPSAACLGTFPFHGVRQYTPRTVSAVTRLYGPETRRTLYALGSSRCNRVHREWITLPRLLRRRDLRKERPDAYDRAVREAIHADAAHPTGAAAFYALVLETRLQPGLLSAR
jgi:SAM-dependent methyltransferase